MSGVSAMVVHRDTRCTVFVTGIPNGATDYELRAALQKFGSVKKLISGKGKPRTYVICEYQEPWSAVLAATDAGSVVVATSRLLIKRYCNARHPLPSDVVRNAATFTEAALALAEDIGVGPADQAVARDLAGRVKESLNAVEVHLLGSVATGLGLKGGDIDLSITTGLDIDRTLGRIQAVWPRAYLVPSRRCPVVRFTDPRTHGQVDITLNNTYAVQNTALLAGFAAGAPVVRELIVLVKAWARACGVGVSGYALAVMAIGYLQRRGMPGGHADEALVRGFFDEYGYRWNYAVQMVRMEQPGGGVVSDAGLAWGRLCVQDPIEHSHNIGGATTAAQLDRMVHAMRSAADALAMRRLGQCAVYDLATTPRPLALWSVERGAGHPTAAHVWVALTREALDVTEDRVSIIEGEGYTGLVRCLGASARVWCECVKGNNDAMAPRIHALATQLNGRATKVHV